MTAQTNPAGMSLLPTSEFIGQIGVVTTESEDTTSVSGLGLSREDNDSGVFGGPLFYYVRPLGDRWHVGLSLAVPGGFGDDYGSDSPTRYLVEEWSLAYVSLVPSLSYKLSDKWSIGVSLPVNYAGYEVENSVLNIGEPDGEMELDADGVAVSLNVGVLYQHSDATRFGLGYRSAVDMELEGEPDFSGLSVATENLLDAAGLLDRDVEIESKLPSIVSAGVYHEFENGWGWAMDVGRIRWSEFKLTEFGFLNGTLFQQDPDYDDAWAGSTGVSVPLNDQWTLGLGIAFMDSPVDKDTRTFAFRTDETWVFGAGFEYDRGNGRTVTFNLNYMDLGAGRIESPPVPVLGNLSAKYDEHWGLIFDLQFKWGS